MKIGFVTFCTISHVEMLKNLIKSVVTFSKHEILVYCINLDYECEFEQVKIKKLKTPNLKMKCIHIPSGLMVQD